MFLHSVHSAHYSVLVVIIYTRALEHERKSGETSTYLPRNPGLEDQCLCPLDYIFARRTASNRPAIV